MLFERTSHRVTPTEAGLAIAARARRVLAELDEARQDVDQLRGRIWIGPLLRAGPRHRRRVPASGSGRKRWSSPSGSLAELEGPAVELRSLAPPATPAVALVWRRDRRPAPAAQAFIDFVRGEAPSRAGGR